MKSSLASGCSSGVTLIAVVALGVLPHLFWATFGFGGGLLVVLVCPLLAGFAGWNIHKAAVGRCWKPISAWSSLCAALFLVLFLYSAQDLGLFYRPGDIVVGAIAVFAGAFISAGALLSLGAALRHARRPEAGRT